MMKFKWSYFVHGAMAIIALSMGAAPGLADGSAQSESYSLTSYVMAGGGGAAASESVSGFFVIAEPVVGATASESLALDAGLLASSASAAGEVVLELSGYESSYGRGDRLSVTITLSNHTSEVSGFTRAVFSAVSNSLNYETDIYDGSFFPLQPGASLSYVYRIRIPPTAPLGFYTIGVAADYQGTPLASASFETEVTE